MICLENFSHVESQSFSDQDFKISLDFYSDFQTKRTGFLLVSGPSDPHDVIVFDPIIDTIYDPI